MRAPEDASDSCEEGSHTLPNELWHMILTYVGPVWQPVAARVCSLWHGLVPPGQRRLAIGAMYELWRDLCFTPAGSRCNTIERCSRLYQILHSLGIFGRLCPTGISGDADKSLIVAALLHTASLSTARSIVNAVRDMGQLDTYTGTPKPALPAHMCSADAIRVAARCGSGAFISTLYHGIVPLHRDLSERWTEAVTSACTAAVRALDISAFAALHRWSYRCCDEAILKAALDEAGVPDQDRGPWFYIIEHVQCPSCGTYDPRVLIAQERAADEAPTIRYHCMTCSCTWRSEP
nr:hypothetical protein [Pandoravirus massiliensis]